MLHIVLYQPEIPQNTGNVIRLSANTGCTLHLIHPLGFTLDNRKLRRAGLDYHQWAHLREHQSLDRFVEDTGPARVFACSTRGQTRYTSARFQAGDALLFGPETRGLPRSVLETLPREQVLRIPMVGGQRSLNLSNAVAIIVYQAWSRLGFGGGE